VAHLAPLGIRGGGRVRVCQGQGELGRFGALVFLVRLLLVCRAGVVGVEGDGSAGG